MLEKMNNLKLLSASATLLISVMMAAIVSANSEQSKTIAIHLGEEKPEGCELLGRVKGTSNDSDQNPTEDKTPYVDRLIKAKTRLREETAELGGDTVHIIRANNSGKYEVPGSDKEIFYIGDVYRCN